MNSLVKYRSILLCLSIILMFACGREGPDLPIDDGAVVDVLAKNKVKGSLSVMVLGSGGPNANPNAGGRASAGYLIFVGGQPRILMDAGSGTYQRLAASGVNIRDLDIILISHLHIDHTAEVSSMIKTAFFHSRGFNIANGTMNFRQASFRIIGPGTGPNSNSALPTTAEYFNGLYAKGSGLERYLYGFSIAITGGDNTDGDDDPTTNPTATFSYEIGFGLNGLDVPADWASYNPQEIISENAVNGKFIVTAVGVRHGPFPALAFRIDYNGMSIVYSGDTNSANTMPDGGNMVALAKGIDIAGIGLTNPPTNADLLIYDTAIMDVAPAALPGDTVFFALHTTPSRIGEVAFNANVGSLLLSHLTPITDPNIGQVISLIQANYTGNIEVAEDLAVYNLDPGN